MPDNQPFVASTSFLLPDVSVIALDGADASVFAQSQFANDVAALAPGHWHWNAWLTPKGRVIALFALLKLAEDSVRLLLPDMPASEFAAQLQRFVFRRKLKITVRDDLVTIGSLAPPLRAQGARLSLDGDQVELDFGSAAYPRRLEIVAATIAAQPAPLSQWRRLDLAFGLPRLDQTQREQWTPQQLALDRLHAFSVKKGCYPGQEIVARTHFLGKAKRALALLEIADDAVPGDAVEQAGHAIGQVVSIAAGVPALGLAVLPLDFAPTGLQARGAEAAVRPLRDGLAR